MAGMNGYEVCRHIKSNDETMFIPIIMLTVLKERDDRIRAIKAGADDFLNKPVDIDVLSARVTSLLKVKRHHDDLMHIDKPGFLINRTSAPRALSNQAPDYLESLEQDALPELRERRQTKINGHIKKFLKEEYPVPDAYPDIEDIVKSHLEIIILKILYERPMCGFELIKEIFMRYNVMLSQGTVYPFLYSLKEEGIVNVGFMKGNLRTKIYSASQEGKQIIEKRINEFIDAEEYILNSIKQSRMNA
jgi:CheY-like chemotaxis protein